MNQRLKVFKYILIILIIVSLLFYKGTIINIFSNIRNITQKQSNIYKGEISILKDNIKHLEEELISLGDTINNKSYNYDLTKISYIDPYNKEFYIYNGYNKEYKENFILKNEFGAVGLIKNVYKDYSKCIPLTSVNNLSVVVNDSYGTLYDYDGYYFKIKNISNYDAVALNDPVYTSPKGIVNEKIYIGSVFKIENNDIEKIIYVKSGVNFNNINYLYVIGGI